MYRTATTLYIGVDNINGPFSIQRGENEQKRSQKAPKERREHKEPEGTEGESERPKEARRRRKRVAGGRFFSAWVLSRFLTFRNFS